MILGKWLKTHFLPVPWLALVALAALSISICNAYNMAYHVENHRQVIELNKRVLGIVEQLTAVQVARCAGETDEGTGVSGSDQASEEATGGSG